jgi:DNA-binding beta-propeller fold protein YncE
MLPKLQTTSSGHRWSAALVVALFCSTACSPLSPRSGTVPAAPAYVLRADVRAKPAGPFLYVAGYPRLSKYALGSSKPLRSIVNYYCCESATLAFDLHGHLCIANGNPSGAQVYEYDPRTLKLLRTLNGVGTFLALVADRSGYLYASTADPWVYVYAPGCTQRVHVIRTCPHRGPFGSQGLVFDPSGDLYVGNGANVGPVCVYAPTQRPGHMKFVRAISEGIDYPGPLAMGPSGELFVANEGGARAFITVYAAGGSKPVRKITEGIKDPRALAVDSEGRLYVANDPNRGSGPFGWISAYAPGASQPARKVKVYNPTALALDPSGNLYVINGSQHSSVLVYSPGAAKLLRKITAGLGEPNGLIVGSP